MEAFSIVYFANVSSQCLISATPYLLACDTKEQKKRLNNMHSTAYIL